MNKTIVAAKAQKEYTCDPFSLILLGLLNPLFYSDGKSSR